MLEVLVATIASRIMGDFIGDAPDSLRYGAYEALPQWSEIPPTAVGGYFKSFLDGRTNRTS